MFECETQKYLRIHQSITRDSKKNHDKIKIGVTKRDDDIHYRYTMSKGCGLRF